MKIGVVSIGNDSLELFRFLHRYDHQYVIYYDADARPLGDKTFDRQLSIIEDGINILRTHWCQHLIVPPVYELARVRSKEDDTYSVLSLYQYYCMKCAFPGSLVGKIWYLAESGHASRGINTIQQHLVHWAASYQRSDAQLQTKQFHRPFARWGRDVRQWKYFLRSLSPRNYLINKVVKFDLRKLKDSDVDTVLPTERSHFAMEKTIERFFNSKRTKRHGMQTLEVCFQQLLTASGELLVTKDDYSVTVLYKGDRGMLESSQKYPWLLGRGKETPIIFCELDGV